MLCEKCLGIPVWLWLVIIGMIAFSCYKTTEKFKSTQNNLNKNLLEKFAEESIEPKQPNQNEGVLKVYNFTAPSWCGYSRNFQSVWLDLVSKINLKYPNVETIMVEFTDMKSTPQANMKLADEFDVRGYPTLIFEMNGKKIEYEGERSAEAIEMAVQKMLSN